MLKISIPSDYRYDATRNTLRGLHGKSKRRIHRLVVFPLNFRDGNTPRESQNSKIRVTSAIDSSFKVLRGTHRVPSIAIATGTRAKCSFEFNFRRRMFRFFFFVFFFFFKLCTLDPKFAVSNDRRSYLRLRYRGAIPIRNS